MAPNYTRMRALAKRLIEGAGRTVTLLTDPSSPANSLEPWLGPDFSAGPSEQSVIASFVPGSGSGLSEVAEQLSTPILQGFEQVALVAAASLPDGFDPKAAHRLRDRFVTLTTLTDVIDGIGDVIDDFLLDESGPPVVSRVSGIEMELDFGAGGDTLVYGEDAVAPDDGTSIRNPSTATPGTFGAVLQHEDAMLVDGLDAFTVVFWFRAMSGGLNKLRTIAGKPQTWAIGSDNTNKLSWGLATDEVAYSQAYSDGTWFDNDHIGEDQMFAGVYDGAEQRVYRNGVLDGALAKTGAVLTPAPGTLSVLTNNLVGFGSQAYMFGNLDRVVVFGKALTATDLLALHEGQRVISDLWAIARVDVLRPGNDPILYQLGLVRK